ncbi:MAG: ABC transporter ATP-binding protein, partial [Planctomycetaceae bacterium]|nr:ABC transporter ATP-binding protein [Planctomycetaceae bacterium]
EPQLTAPARPEGSPLFGFVFQHPTLLPWRTALENLRLPFEVGPAGTSMPVTEEELFLLMEQVGLQRADAGKRPSELSGGMQMRLSLARALAPRPGILLLDEPLAAVDDLLRMRLQEDVRRLHEQRQLTTLLVTHNIHEAVLMADRILVLGGRPAELQLDYAVPGPAVRTADFRESPEFHAGVRAVLQQLTAM